jgi:hypothetical protein
VTEGDAAHNGLRVVDSAASIHPISIDVVSFGLVDGTIAPAAAPRFTGTGNRTD